MRASDRNRRDRTVGDAARKVGGYGELLRIEQERRAIEERGGKAAITKGPDGRYRCVEVVRRAAPEPVRAPSLLSRILGFVGT